MTRKIPHTLVFLSVALLTLLLGARPAAAHATLESSEPAARTTVTSLTRVILRFEEPVEAAGSHLWLEDADDVIDLGSAHHPDGDGRALEAAVPSVTSGQYVVGYHVVATDGDPVVGAVPFVFAAPAVDGQPSALPSAAVPAASAEILPQPHRHGDDLPAGAARVLLDASLATLVGGIAFVVSVWPQGASSRGTRRLLWGAALAAAVASFVLAAEQHATATGLSIGQALQPSHLRATLHYRFGRVALLRVGLLAAAAVLVTRIRSLSRRGPLSAVLCALGGVIAFGLFETIVLLGHGGGGRLESAARLIHTIGVSVWLGGLVMLLAFVLPGRRRDELVAVLPRFSRLATITVGAVLVAGVVLADDLVGGASSLVTTGYGRVLLLKVAVVIGLLIIAQRSRDHVHRTLSRSTNAIARPLATWITVELGLMAVVFALTALLVSHQPPA